MSNATQVTAPGTTAIAPYRLHVVDIAKKAGWKVVQTATNVDTFTKGAVTRTVSWAATQMGEATGTDGLLIAHRESAKLQKLVRALGVKMSDTELFKSVALDHPAKLTPKRLAELKLRAAKEIRVIAAKA